MSTFIVAGEPLAGLSTMVSALADVKVAGVVVEGWMVGAGIGALAVTVPKTLETIRASVPLASAVGAGVGALAVTVPKTLETIRASVPLASAVGAGVGALAVTVPKTLETIRASVPLASAVGGTGDAVGTGGAVGAAHDTTSTPSNKNLSRNMIFLSGEGSSVMRSIAAV